MNNDLKGKITVISGGTGVLGCTISQALYDWGAQVILLVRDATKAQTLISQIQAQAKPGQNGSIDCIVADVLDQAALLAAREQIMARYGRIDILVNGAGGNRPDAASGPDKRFFDLAPAAISAVVEVNLLGSIIPSQVFGQVMADQGNGMILNIASMSGFTPLSRVVAYSAAKAGIANFTQWLAVHLAQEYSANIRVNAIAPGFFLTEQNRFLLTNQDGSLTARGQAILAHTPQQRFGQPEDLLGAVEWLLSPSAAFVTGVVIPIDGGFNAFAGV